MIVAREEDNSDVAAESSKPKVIKGQQPLLNIITQLKPSQITRLIEWHAEWAETLESVDIHQALWFYVLLSSVSKPLHPDTESSMRSFVIQCSKQRNDIVKSSVKFSHLNLIICLVAKYFGQADLADD